MALTGDSWGVPYLTLRKAREKQDELAAQVANGKSPAVEAKQRRVGLSTNPTVKEFGERYYKEQVLQRWKDPKTIRRYLDNEISPTLGEKALKDADALDVQALLLSQARQWTRSGCHATPQRHKADIRLRD